MRVLINHLVAPDAKGLPRATVVRAGHLTIAIKAVEIYLAACDRCFWHAVG